MKFTKIIITAMPQEAEKIIEKYQLLETKKIGFLRIYTGEREDSEGEKEEIILALCGVGKIHATFATTYLFENYDITKLINIGVVGNLRGDMMQIGDVILPNTFLQHDIYIPSSIETMSYLRDPIFLEQSVGEDYDLTKFELRLHGICLTGDQFIDSDDKVLELEENYGADIVDMEAYAILSVAKAYDKLDICVVIKSISDGADNEAMKDFPDNLDFAMQNAIAILDFVL